MKVLETLKVFQSGAMSFVLLHFQGFSFFRVIKMSTIPKCGIF